MKGFQTMTLTIVRNGQKITTIVAKIGHNNFAAIIQVDSQLLWKEDGWSSPADARMDALTKRRELVGI